MNYQDTHKQLYELGIASQQEAEELEYELDLRFEDFSPSDRETWIRQTRYLSKFSQFGTTTSAARGAEVTVYTAQRWERDDVLRFNRRLEAATLALNDNLQAKALLRASDPNAPVTLIITLLRANMPEKYFAKGDKRDRPDRPKELEQLDRYREHTHHEKADGYPTLTRITQDDPDPSAPTPSPAPEEDWGEGTTPDQPTPTSHPTGEVPVRPEPVEGQLPVNAAEAGIPESPSAPTPSPVPGENWDEGTPPDQPTRTSRPTGTSRPIGEVPVRPEPVEGQLLVTPAEVGFPDFSSTPHAPTPSPAPEEGWNEGPTTHQYPDRHTGEGWYPETPPGPTGPTDEELTRAARRELLRHQRKREKKNVFPAKRF